MKYIGAFLLLIDSVFSTKVSHTFIEFIEQKEKVILSKWPILREGCSFLERVATTNLWQSQL